YLCHEMLIDGRKFAATKSHTNCGFPSKVAVAPPPVL
ncbi:MAG: hypothetical protein ACI8TQ_002994, partial [Planctomycetota bacterium]